MAFTEYVGKHFRVKHTVEEDGPHPTIPYDYYDETYAITFILQGRGICYIEGEGYPLEDGNLVILSPDEIRSFRLEQNGRHERVSIYFTDILLTDFCDYTLPLQHLFRARPLGSGNWYTPADYDSEQILPFFQQLITFVEKETPEREARMHLMILQLLFALYDHAESMPKESDSQNNIVAELCNYIKNNLNQDLSYHVLQNRFFLSRYQLSEVFRRHTGMTLTEYIIHKRLMRVISLVRAGEGIETAAYQAGFHTYSHFYKEFKKRYNTSPKKYLQN